MPFDPFEMMERFMGTHGDVDRAKLKSVSISWAEEQRVGQEAARAFMNQMRRQHVTIQSRGQDVQYVQQLIAAIRPHMANATKYRRITVYVADTDATDAKCFPGGIVIVTRGMLDFAPSEAALVGVLAHELSHIDHGHQLDHLRAMKLAQQTFQPGRQGMDFRQMFANGMTLMQMFARPFRPEDETVADHDATVWMFRNGYDPREFAKLFRELQSRDRGKDEMVPMFFRTHPYHQDRYAAVMKTYRELHATAPDRKLYVGQQNLRRRVPRSKREFPE